MKNWNTDTSKFTSFKQKRLWELQQLINYGLDGAKLSENELKKYWPELKIQLDPERARMLELLLWNKKYSLPNKGNYWNQSHK